MGEEGLKEPGSEENVVQADNCTADLGEPPRPPTPTEEQPKPYAEFTSFSEADATRSFLFSHMADHPWPYLLLIPIAFALLIGFGWTTDDMVETDTSRMWIADKGAYARNQRYAKSLGVHESGASSFAAMATSRDGKNILTSNRLEEIRARMEKVENITIDYKGNNYTWDDLCGNNPAPYQFPCLRYSAMDLFQEARWTFSDEERVTYYESAIKNFMIKPLLPRVGIMLEECAEACAFVTAYRLDPESIGYPADVANPFGLFGDVGSMGYHHPCRICIEESYTAKIKELHATITNEFGALRKFIVGSMASAESKIAEDKELVHKQLNGIATKLGQLESSLTTDDVVDFNFYYVARRMYGELGVESYLKLYSALAGDGYKTCQLGAALFGLTCPPPPSDIDADTARQHLLNHADNTFSSVVTSGVPLPFWSEADGTGYLFRANADTGKLSPVSGSGVNMSAPMTSLVDYMRIVFLERLTPDPNSQLWNDMIGTNPYYAWFMSGLTTAERGMMCHNGNLTGTDTGIKDFDGLSSELMANATQRWCTKYDLPNPSDPGTGNYTKQHFARMWFDLLFTSEYLLNFTKGQDDPYTWTIGTGCGYVLGGERYSYANQTEEDILHNASRLVYNIDEGASVGPVDRNLLIGGATPTVGEYDYENPLKEVTVLQTLYAALFAKDLVKRVQNCHRPGGPVNITLEDAKGILYTWKEAMETTWNEGFNNETNGEVEFVSVFGDGGGAMGSIGRMLEEMTVSGNALLAVSVVLIAVFSTIFLFSRDVVESRVLLAVIGVCLALLSFFAGVGFALIVNVKINVAIAWTLPFVIIGLGVDDIYIVLLAIKNQSGYSKRHFLKAMKEVVVPVTMTSLVNASMFAVMNLSDYPVVYDTARIALFCIIALYVAVIFCFPAYCYLDLQRQEAGRMDVLFCLKSSAPPTESKQNDFRNIYLYDKFYKPIMLSSKKKVRYLNHTIIMSVSIAVFAIGAWGMTQRQIGVGLESFFPTGTALNRWATIRSEKMQAEAIGMHWGPLDYANPDIQMKMIKQFEDIVANPRVSEVDTKQLWIAQFAIWASRHCGGNYARAKFDELKCGRDQMFKDGSYCAATWVPNKFGLREQIFSDPTDDTCQAYSGGVCRSGDQMHPDDLQDIGLDSESGKGQVFCPVIKDWSDEKWKFCLKSWRTITGTGHKFKLEDEIGSPTECSGVYKRDEEVAWPMPYSSAPLMFGFSLYTHQITVDFIEETRAVCDYDEEVHCWMSGGPYDYWEQYIGIFGQLMKHAGYTAAVGFGIAALFLFARLSYERNHPTGQILIGSLVGAFLIAISIIFTLVPVIGLSSLAGVNLTGFSNMSFLFSVGFAVEYSVHIVSRWMRADLSHATSLDRVDYTMSFLMVPTFMSFVSSTIGIICLAFTEFEFNRTFFFRPLMIVMFVSYWMGCWFLPVLLIYLDFDFVKLGKPRPVAASLSRSKTTLTENSPSKATVDFAGDRDNSAQATFFRNDLSTESLEEASGKDKANQVRLSEAADPSRDLQTISDDGQKVVIVECQGQVKHQSHELLGVSDQAISVEGPEEVKNEQSPYLLGVLDESNSDKVVKDECEGKETLQSYESDDGPDEVREDCEGKETPQPHEFLVASDHEINKECEEKAPFLSREAPQPNELPAVSDQAISGQEPEIVVNEWKGKGSIPSLEAPQSHEGPEEAREECEGKRSVPSGETPQLHELLAVSDRMPEHVLEDVNGIGSRVIV